MGKYRHAISLERIDSTSWKVKVSDFKAIEDRIKSKVPPDDFNKHQIVWTIAFDDLANELGIGGSYKLINEDREGK